MDQTREFWLYLDELIAGSKVVIDRPKGSLHPRFPGEPYPMDYGYLEGTTTVDGGGIDLWMGSLPGKELTGIVCTVDLFKKDGEMKLLLGCSSEDAEQVLRFTNNQTMRAIYIPRREGG